RGRDKPFGGPFRVGRFVGGTDFGSPFGVVHPLDARKFEFVMAEDRTAKCHSIVATIDGKKHKMDISNALVEDSAGIISRRGLRRRIGQNVSDKGKRGSGIGIEGVPVSRTPASGLIVSLA